MLSVPNLPLTSPAPSSISILLHYESPPVFPLSSSSSLPPQRVGAPMRRPLQVNFQQREKPRSTFNNPSFSFKKYAKQLRLLLQPPADGSTFAPRGLPRVQILLVL